MKTKEYTFLGLKVNKEVPSTNEEFDKAADQLNAACEEAVDKYMYHNWGGKFRDAFCAAVETETKVAWPLDEDAMKRSTPKKDGSVTDVHIAAGEYFKNHVLRQTGRTAESFQELAATVAAKIAFDPSASAVGGRIGKEFTAAAEQVLEKGPEAVASVVATLVRLNPGLSLDDAPSAEDLARAIKVNAERKKKEAAAELGL